MEFQEFVKQYNRMCYSFDDCQDRNGENCPLHEFVKNEKCESWLINHSLRGEDIIAKWAAENPIMTNGMKFKEVFGIEIDGRPSVMCDNTDISVEDKPITEWWNQEYQLPEKE